MSNVGCGAHLKLLIDRCAGRHLAAWLEAECPDVRTARARDPDPGDMALLQIAVEDGRILVTMDSEFITLIYIPGAGYAGLVRLPDIPATVRTSMRDNSYCDLS